MILLVDDIAENRFSLQKTLVGHGFGVDTAASGEEALKMALKKSYVLVILDVQMPGMDGFEVAELLSGYSGAKNTAILFLSAAALEQKFLLRGLQNGAVDYVTKPVEPLILIAKINTFYHIYEQNRILLQKQKELEAEIASRKKAESLKDEFVSIASHELKTPLTSAKAYMQLLARNIDGGDNSKSGQYLEKASMQVNRLDELISDLLDLSKIESGKMSFTMVSLEMETILESVLETFRDGYPHYDFRLLSSAAARITADPARIEQVLVNLLTNAIKYAPESEIIEIESELIGNSFLIRVRDFGIGISAESLDAVFNKFYRTSEVEKNFSGLGMGLYISKEIIHQHGGQLSVESTLGKGSTFYLSLPIP
ncbi:hybrid sensor histidine kinase/response regulator [Pedobacter agri]|uniref:histidine kinase n=1 Tax=Pedobacter agri TaxID=454586 RepID=A0A9X3DBN5_9SPHI|nr:ATP-binding protein [Pedobacter agri]MCX3264185.1 ATP-binding protein [Pedobacter agri]